MLAQQPHAAAGDHNRIDHRARQFKLLDRPRHGDHDTRLPSAPVFIACGRNCIIRAPICALTISGSSAAVLSTRLLFCATTTAIGKSIDPKRGKGFQVGRMPAPPHGSVPATVKATGWVVMRLKVAWRRNAGMPNVAR